MMNDHQHEDFCIIQANQAKLSRNFFEPTPTIFALRRWR